MTLSWSKEKWPSSYGSSVKDTRWETGRSVPWGTIPPETSFVHFTGVSAGRWPDRRYLLFHISGNVCVLPFGVFTTSLQIQGAMLLFLSRFLWTSLLSLTCNCSPWMLDLSSFWDGSWPFFPDFIRVSLPATRDPVQGSVSVTIDLTCGQHRGIQDHLGFGVVENMMLKLELSFTV